MIKGFKPATRGQRPVSYIVVLDNVADENGMEKWEANQRIRKASTLKQIFDAAGLSILEKIGPEVLVKGDHPVMMWALA